MKTYKGDVPKPEPHQSIIFGATSEGRIKALFNMANEKPDEEFIIPYKATTTVLPGNLTALDIAIMFATQPTIPPNIILEETFLELIKEVKTKEI